MCQALAFVGFKKTTMINMHFYNKKDKKAILYNKICGLSHIYFTSIIILSSAKLPLENCEFVFKVKKM